MTEIIQDIWSNPSTPLILIILIFAIIIIVILARTGYLSINTRSDKLNVSIGGADRERDIIRHQVEWIRHHLEGLEAKMEKPEQYDTWRGKFVVEKVYDEYVDIITFNHITDIDTYVKLKQDLIVATVNKYVELEFFKTKKFENMLREDTKYCIEQLVQIRRMYK